MLGISIPAFVFSQFADNWVNYNQQYFKFKVHSQGIYRIYKQDLLNGGVPIGSINPKNIQILRNGKEIPIYIKGEDDYIFNDNDYIEFYAYPNDGTLDTSLYETASQQANPYVSLINDTATYFLTWKNDATPKLRYTVINDSTEYTITDKCYQTVLQNYISSYYLGQSAPTYTEGEGWFDNTTFYNNHNVTKTILTPQLVSTTNASIELCFVGTPSSDVESNIFHHTIVYLNGNPIIDTNFSDFNFIRKNLSSALSSANQFTFTANYESSYIDRQAVSYIKIDYLRFASFDNEATAEIYLTPSATHRTLQISNFNGGDSPTILDYKNGYKIIPVKTSTNTYNINIPPATNNNTLFIANEDQVKEVNDIQPAEMTNYFTNKNYDLIIITNKLLKTSAEEYANYRTQQGYSTLIAYIDELYNEFSYGIEKDPLAIKNFLRKVYYTYDSLPDAVFLIGKGIHNRYSKTNTIFYAQNLVPTWGDPSSDNIMAARLDTLYQGLEPQIPIGRLSATNNQEVLDYLQKIKEYESAPKEEWMKHILHLGGGSNQQQQTLFESYLHDYEDIIEDTLFGGYVYTFIKNSSLPISQASSDSIRSIIDSGITLLTFFGHGSSSGFDQNIDYPQNYNNTGKYPAIISNSCLTGDIHLPPPQKISEQWVFTPEKGSIAFVASADLGYTSMLHLITTELYKQISYLNYGKPIGKQIQEAIKNFSYSYTDNPYYVKMAYDFTLLGDPLLKLNYSNKPDFLIHTYDIKFTPPVITSATDSFQVTFCVTNIGKATTDTFLTGINRTIGNYQWTGFVTHNGCLYKDTVTITLPSVPMNNSGMNSICFYADQIDQINELDETNNQTCLEFMVSSDLVFPVYPYEYAIYPYDTLTLKASTGNPLNFSGQVIFQIDTNDYFTSPVMQQQVVNISPGGVVKWHLPFTLQDSTVYYWRVSKLNTNNWIGSSFIYIPGKTGWSQAHFYQFSKDDYTFISFNRSNRDYEYVQTPVQLFCRNIGNAGSASFYDIKYFMGDNGDYSCCGASDAIMVAVFDSTFLTPWESNRGEYGHRNYPKCPSRSRNDFYFVFSTDSFSLVNMANFIHDSVPDNDYILLYSWRNGHFQNWPEIAYQKLEDLGASNIRFIQDNYPYIFFTKKGTPSSSISATGNSPTDTITLTHNILTNFYYGKIKSPLIGPVQNLHSVHWHYKQKEINSDSTVFKFLSEPSDTNILSQTNNNLDTILLQTISNYYKFSMFTMDSSFKTPSQPTRWQLIFDEIPETAINPAKGFYFPRDSVQQGDSITFSIATENISHANMDSLVVRYYLIDENNYTSILKTKKLRPHPAGDVLSDTITFSTKNLLGQYFLRVEYNPINENTGDYYQLEQYHFNNIAEVRFTVSPDNTNPILDVTFDGRHIMNYESVAKQPVIKISLRDENNYFLLDDTSAFEIYLSEIKQDTTITHRIFFNNSYPIEFHPATSLSDNYCYAIFKPELSPGIYKLSVQGVDKSGNLSGDNNYEVYFVVDSLLSIEHFYTFPNPFRNKTYFAFTIKNHLPDEFYIDIYNLQGKFIKRLNLLQENIFVGHNITNIYWDSTDNFNKHVPQGIYIYKVTASYKGIPVQIKVSTPNNSPLNGFGKIIYLK